MTHGASLPTQLKVLVVDDLSTVRKVIAKILGNLGVSLIQQAKDGVEALECVRKERPDLIITDWEMPRLTGIEFVKQLRADPAFAAIPVLLVTSHAQRERVVEAAEAGISDFIVKPFGEDVILKKLLQVLGQAPATPPA